MTLINDGFWLESTKKGIRLHLNSPKECDKCKTLNYSFFDPVSTEEGYLVRCNSCKDENRLDHEPKAKENTITYGSFKP